MNQYVLYQDIVELYAWSMTSSGGARVKIRLKEREDLTAFEGERPMRRSRTGKPPVGSLFALSFTRVADQMCFDVVAWYKGPSWSAGVGAVITFELEEEAHLAPFRQLKAADAGDEGEELAMVVVQLDDNGCPVDQVAKQRVMAAAAATPKVKGGPKSKRCARMCEDMEFVPWFIAREYLPADATAAQVAGRVRDILQINSRAELDTNDEAWERWRVIERDFIRAREGVPA